MKTFHLQTIAGRDRIATVFALLLIGLSVCIPASSWSQNISAFAHPILNECESSFDPPSNGAPSSRQDAASR